MNGGGELWGARERSLAALEGGERLGDLREAAYELGTALFATAEDDELWRQLENATGRGRTDRLSAEQRAQLRGIVRLDWAWLLNEAGYQPPPPAEGVAIELQQAIAQALATGERASLDAAREKLRSLGTQLAELSGQEKVSYTELRRLVRKGVRVAGKVLIVIGVIAASTAATAAVSAVLPAASPFVVAIGVGMVMEGAGILANRALDRALGEDEPEPQGNLDAADWEAFTASRRMREPELLGLVERWRDAGPDQAEELMAETRKYYEDTTSAFYAALDAAVGAPWYSAVAPLFESADAERRRLQEEVMERNRPNAVETADRLQRFGIRIGELRRELERIRLAG
jgi:hypothetical protein